MDIGKKHPELQQNSIKKMNGSQTFSGGAGGDDDDDSDGFVDEGETSRGSVMPSRAAAATETNGVQDISDNTTESEDSKVNQALSILGLVCTVLRLCSRYSQLMRLLATANCYLKSLQLA